MQVKLMLNIKIILNKYIFSQKNQGQSQKRNLTTKGGNQNFDI